LGLRELHGKLHGDAALIPANALGQRAPNRYPSPERAEESTQSHT
jgi:hypothetical protein